MLNLLFQEVKYFLLIERVPHSSSNHLLCSNIFPILFFQTIRQLIRHDILHLEQQLNHMKRGIKPGQGHHFSSFNIFSNKQRALRHDIQPIEAIIFLIIVQTGTQLLKIHTWKLFRVQENAFHCFCQYFSPNVLIPKNNSTKSIYIIKRVFDYLFCCHFPYIDLNSVLFF